MTERGGTILSVAEIHIGSGLVFRWTVPVRSSEFPPLEMSAAAVVRRP